MAVIVVLFGILISNHSSASQKTVVVIFPALGRVLTLMKVQFPLRCHLCRDRSDEFMSHHMSQCDGESFPGRPCICRETHLQAPVAAACFWSSLHSGHPTACSCSIFSARSAIRFLMIYLSLSFITSVNCFLVDRLFSKMKSSFFSTIHSPVASTSSLRRLSSGELDWHVHSWKRRSIDPINRWKRSLISIGAFPSSVNNLITHDHAKCLRFSRTRNQMLYRNSRVRGNVFRKDQRSWYFRHSGTVLCLWIYPLCIVCTATQFKHIFLHNIRAYRSMSNLKVSRINPVLQYKIFNINGGFKTAKSASRSNLRKISRTNNNNKDGKRVRSVGVRRSRWFWHNSDGYVHNRTTNIENVSHPYLYVPTHVQCSYVCITFF